ncbi:MAG: energy-coupled thiamine transporter ThiT [Clostridia bacterium]|nr:energy-coupled thiamine transporter ThiT [Clostridia bacterium]
MDFDTLFSNLGYVALYLALAIIGIGTIVGILIKKFKPDYVKDFVKVLSGIVIGYAVAVVVIMTYIKMQDTDIEPLLFYPILATLITAIVSGIALLIALPFGKKPVQITAIVSGALLAGCFVALMVCMSKQFDIIGSDYEHASTVGLIVSAIVVMAILALAVIFSGKKDTNNTRALVYGAVAIALSFALSYARLFRMPQGGSITFASVLPLIIYSMMFGTRRGVLVSLIYGTLQALQDPYILHPMQFLLDYPLAYGLVGVSGFFADKKFFKNKHIINFLLGGVVAVCLRYACHVCSGVFAFADYFFWDEELMSTYSTAAAYSLAYNSSVFVDMAIALACGAIMLSSKAFVRQMEASALPLTVPTDDDECDNGEDAESLVNTTVEKEQNNSEIEC